MAADDIRRLYRHLQADGPCGNALTSENENISKQVYNDALNRLLTVSGFLQTDAVRAIQWIGPPAALILGDRGFFL